MTDTYISIDLETTGINPKLDKITEIGALKVIDGEVADTFISFVNPGRKLEERVVELTGIHDEDLADAPDIREILPPLLEFLGEYPLLGHSILFDYSFLKKAAVDQKFSFERTGIDTLKIAKKYLGSLEHRNLDYLCAYYGIAHRAHRAFADAEATDALYRRLTKEFYSEEDRLFVPAPLIYKIKRDQPALPSQKEKLYRLIEQHKITMDADVEKLSRSEASRFIDKILARYGR